jgi:GNAT superfamily N-acetyltransferase
MLAVDPKQRSLGAGRKLVDFVEQWSREMGYKFLECGVVNPIYWELKSKDALVEWYMRIGFRKVGKGRFEDAYPTMKDNLVTECEYVTFRKDLV